jgi:hypothetical protein
LPATGFFRTHHDGQRWWLVDPQGHLFWSAGIDCVGPSVPSVTSDLEAALAWTPPAQGQYAAAWSAQGPLRCCDFLIANFIRAFGPQAWREHWWKIAQAQLRMFGFNTVGNWSAWEAARAAGFPYVRSLELACRRTPMAYRDFPDVFHPNFVGDAAEFAEALRITVGDKALIGYFLMNEPTWGFSQETPAVGMLRNAAADCQTRKALAEFLRRRHGTDARLSAAWGINTTYISIAFNEFKSPLNATALADLEAFSSVMVERLYRTLSEACRKVDPDHLNLGPRYYTVPPEWCLEGLKCFDVLSLNAYQQRIPAADYEKISARLQRPVLVGEWHFGALDAGLPATGIQRVRTQKDRAAAYRAYIEGAAACPACVGAHYFQMYDQSFLGRGDGENYNIGFVDVCNRPYEDLAWGARASHERIYQVAAGETAPFAEMPEYLPALYY